MTGDWFPAHISAENISTVRRTYSKSWKKEVCEKLHVSRRTLQALRDEKAIPYTSITAAGGKLLYPESGLYEVLKKNYKDFRRYAG